MENIEEKIKKATSFEDAKKIISKKFKELRETPCSIPSDDSLKDFNGSYRAWLEEKEKLKKAREKFEADLEDEAKKYIIMLDNWIKTFYKSDDISPEEIDIIFNKEKDDTKLYCHFWERYDAIIFSIEDDLSLYKKLLEAREK